jgi:hypothetical protein
MALKNPWSDQQSKQGWQAISLAVFCLLWLSGINTCSREEVTRKAPSSPAQQSKPSDAQWQPNELQRAMVLGTTTPNEQPMTSPPSDYPDSDTGVMEEPFSSSEEIPLIFRKPIPITSPAKPRQPSVNSSPTPR